MKRLFSLAILGTAALLVPSSVVNAQMRGGGGGGHMGGGGGFHSSGSSGFHSAGQSGFHSAPSGFRSSGAAGFRAPSAGGFRSSSGFVGVRSSGVRSSGVRTTGFRSFGPRTTGVRTVSSSRGTFVGVNHVGASHVFVGHTVGFNSFHNNFVFFHGCFGCFSPFFFNGGFFFGSPFFGFGFGAPFFPYYPYYGGYGYGGYGPYYAPPVSSDYSSTDNTAQLSADVQNLSNQVADLRNDVNGANGENANSGNYVERAPPGTSLSATEPSVATVFIFRDGLRVTGQNYAIAGATLWVFNERSARKYPMADLDAAATEKANAANGVEFHIPEPQEKH